MNDSTSLNVCLHIKTKLNRKGRDKRIKISHSFKTIVAGKGMIFESIELYYI